MVWKNGKPQTHELAADILPVIRDSLCCAGVVPPVLGQHHPTISGLLDMRFHRLPRPEVVSFLSQLV